MEGQHSYQSISHDIKVSATPYLVPERSDPEKNKFYYAYHIQFTNEGEQSMQLLRRFWRIRMGHMEEVSEGPGVVGVTPTLAPGESFDYTSFCPLNTPFGNMRGHYLFKDENGQKYRVEIPLFFLRPNAPLAEITAE